MSKYRHAPKQAWQTVVLIQCRYGLSGVILFYFSYYSKYMNLLHNHVLQIYVLFLYTYGKTNESGKNGLSLMRHIYKRFFSKIKVLRNYVGKKRTDIGTMPWIRKKKIKKNRPMLWGKIVLMILFIRSHFVIDRSCTTIKLHISSAS